MADTLKDLIESTQRPPSGFWQDVVDTMNEALIVVSTDRRILYSNARAEELTGMPLAQAQGRLCIDVISCPQCDCECRLFREGKVDHREVEVFHPGDGKRRVFLKNARLLHDAEGQVIGGVETFKDITTEVAEREANRRRIDQLFHEKKRTEALVGSLAEGVFVMDMQHTIRDFSPRMTDLTGFRSEEAEGQNFFHLLSLNPRMIPSDDSKELTRQPIQAELRSKDGRYKPVEIRFQAVRFNQEEILGLVRDLTPDPRSISKAESFPGFQGIITRAPAMRKIFALAESAAESDINILIEGESGTGKELVARAIHRLGSRNQEPFYAVNCATFTGSLLLSELFGHERGAFTGAVKEKRGKLELAGTGTLFLDEVSEIPIQHQALLLRVLEERTFERVGGHLSIDMGARIIAATNQSLSRALQEGRFREDLYYRLKVVPIRIPPLRERPEDIELLLQYFLRQCAGGGDTPKVVSSEVMEILRAYPWPGNVRELRNLIEYLCFAAGDRIQADDLPGELVDCARSEPGKESDCREVHEDMGERQRILLALQKTNFHRTRAADLLGVDRSTLWRKMRRLGIQA